MHYLPPDLGAALIKFDYTGCPAIVHPYYDVENMFLEWMEYVLSITVQAGQFSFVHF